MDQWHADNTSSYLDNQVNSGVIFYQMIEDPLALVIVIVRA